MITIKSIEELNILIGEIEGWDFFVQGYDLDKPHYVLYQKNQNIIRANFTWGVNKILTIPQIASTIDLVNEKFNIVLHGLHDNNTVNFKSSSTLPPGIVATQKYYVVDSTSNSFKISNTLGGAPIDIVNLGTGTLSIFCNKRNFLPAGVNAITSFFNISDHLLSDDDPISFDASPGGYVAWPVDIGKTYYVVNSNANSFQISETIGGSFVPLINTGLLEQYFLTNYGSENLVNQIVFEQSTDNGASYTAIGTLVFDYGNLGRLIKATWI